RYKEISDMVFEILRSVSPAVEPLSIDEAFVELTGTQRLLGNPVETARRVKERILEKTGLVASVGVAPNKFLAKLASEHDKPNGFVVIEKDKIREFLDKLPIRDLWGVGPSTQKILERLGIFTVKDLAGTPPEVLRRKLGDHGEGLWRLSQGMDDRPVSSEGDRKGISKETTYNTDVTDLSQKKTTLRYLADKLSARMRDKGVSGRTITVKIRYTGFTTITRSNTLPIAISTSDELFREAMKLALPELEGSIRLLGIRISNIVGEEGEQLPLFGTEEIEKSKRLEQALDSIHDKFGNKSIDRAKILRDRKKRE
ncbi:MAG: DNA polymerase Y family protein, partial [bacterium]